MAAQAPGDCVGKKKQKKNYNVLSSKNFRGFAAAILAVSFLRGKASRVFYNTSS